MPEPTQHLPAQRPTADYLRLSTPPHLVIRRPRCSACESEVRTENRQWVCEGCGTAWPLNSSHETVGVLFEDWAGQSLGDRPAINADVAWKYAHLPPGEREDRAAAQGDLADRETETTHA